jgi:hypothetical protein
LSNPNATTPKLRRRRLRSCAIFMKPARARAAADRLSPREEGALPQATPARRSVHREWARGSG